MFDLGIGYFEMVVIAIVAVIVIGPKDLPSVLRAFGRTVAKMRGMAREFQGHLDQAMREAGMDEVKKEVQNLKTMATSAAEPIRSAAASVSEPLKSAVTDMKTAVADTATTAKKEGDDFRNYFGEGGGKVIEPPKPAAGKSAAPAS